MVALIGLLQPTHCRAIRTGIGQHIVEPQVVFRLVPFVALPIGTIFRDEGINPTIRCFNGLIGGGNLFAPALYLSAEALHSSDPDARQSADLSHSPDRGDP